MSKTVKIDKEIHEILLSLQMEVYKATGSRPALGDLIRIGIILLDYVYRKTGPEFIGELVKYKEPGAIINRIIEVICR